MGAPTKIGRGTVVRGKISGDGHVEIDGRVEGAITVDGEITVGDFGRVKADGAVSGHSIWVHGAVAGSLQASHTVVLEQGARVVGDLSAPSVGIRPGGLLRGHVSTGDSAAPHAVGRRVERAEPASRAASSSARETVARPTAARPAPPTKAAHRSPPARVPATTRARDLPEKLVEPKASPLTRGRDSKGRAPAPVMPALKKGQKGQLKKKNG